MSSSDSDDRRGDLLGLVKRARRLAESIDHPVWADLSDAEHAIEDEFRRESGVDDDE
jgi:hypothetical protein